MKPETGWLWAARISAFGAVVSAFTDAPDIRVGVTFLMATIMYATSAILRALSTT